METIGTRIRALREAQDKTPLELAYESEVSMATLARYERGEIPEALERLQRIAGALGVPLSSLIAIHDEIDGTTSCAAVGGNGTTQKSSAAA